MNTKQRLFVNALADGLQLEDAAAEAGYNVAYARKKLREPAIQRVVDKLTEARNSMKAAGVQPPAPEDSEKGALRSADQILWDIILDPFTDAAQRVSAVRALVIWERAHASEESGGDVTLIDDVPPDCEHCPNLQYALALGRKMATG